jgi:hypothetical protein
MNTYDESYFNEGIFSTNYSSLAQTIFDAYKPKKVIEFGCGPGHLTRALNKFNVEVLAIDGFSEPDFKDFPGITFSKIDLNDGEALSIFLNGKKFDMAICTEVAEHLMPSSSNNLIKCLTSSAPIVIFSAAIPEQGGTGHINCMNRGYWHDLFLKHNFRIVDSIRKNLRDSNDLALWYKLNLLDYVIKDNKKVDNEDVIKNLIDSESYSSSMLYKVQNENIVNEAYLRYPLVKQYFQLRNFLKGILRK